MGPTTSRVATALLATAIGCTDGASSDPAYDASMRIQSAQFVVGAPPNDTSGPNVEAIDLTTKTIWPGYWDKLLKGALGTTATACSLRLVNDVGYWIVLAGIPDVATPKFPSFRATAAFNERLSEGAYEFEVRAIDGAGRFGPPKTETLTALNAMPSRQLPRGALVVSLVWDTDVDLDLHVVDPLGDEIYHGAPSSEDGFTPGAASSLPGVLDMDSNASCVVDGWRREDVIWATAPPLGTYEVRVDTPSLCDQNIAHWQIYVFLNDKLIAQSSGVSLDSDTWGAHGRGAGFLAATFDVK